MTAPNEKPPPVVLNGARVLASAVIDDSVIYIDHS